LKTTKPEKKVQKKTFVWITHEKERRRNQSIFYSLTHEKDFGIKMIKKMNVVRHSGCRGDEKKMKN